MRNVLVGLAAVALAACSAKASQAPAGMSPQDGIVAAPMASAQMMFQRGAYDIAMGSLEREMQPDVLNQLTPAKREELVDLYARAAWNCEAYAKAHDAFRLAAQSPLATTTDWVGRMLSAAKSDDPADAYISFEHLRATAATALEDVPTPYLVPLDVSFGALPNAEAARLELAELTAPVDLGANNPMDSLSPLWLQAAVASIDKGDDKQAVRFARQSLVRMSWRRCARTGGSTPSWLPTLPHSTSRRWPMPNWRVQELSQPPTRTAWLRRSIWLRRSTPWTAFRRR